MSAPVELPVPLPSKGQVSIALKLKSSQISG